MKNIFDRFKNFNRITKKLLLNLISEEEWEMLRKNINYSSSDIKEIFYLNRENLKEIPKCPICGNNKKFLGIGKQYCNTCGNKQCIMEFSKQKAYNTKLKRYGDPYWRNPEKAKQTCLEKYGVECSWQSENNKQKSKQTKLKRYGNENYVNSEKNKQTCLERYGTTTYLHSTEGKERAKQTILEKYGVENIQSNEKIKEKIRKVKLEKYGSLNNYEKIKQTVLEKYGVENISQSEEIKNKKKETCLKHYGVEYYLQLKEVKHHMSEVLSSPEILDKIYKTKKKNNSFKKSDWENTVFNKLLEKFPDTISQFKDKRYPFNCDFYIPELDLFIECNFHWTHGKHIFNENNEEDLKIINDWKNKNSQYYNNAINTWTKLDIEKYNTAKENNLNYLIFYNMKDFEKWLNNL